MALPTRPHQPRRTVLWALVGALAALGPAAALGEAGCPEGMRAVPGGRFTLADGSQVAEISPLCLDVAEVTVAAFAACVQRGACAEEGLRCGKAATWGAKGKAGHPVNCVTWHDADGFCRASGKRLPTEAEWEWAARGRLRALPYPWGSTPPSDQACWDGPGNTLGKGGRNEPCAVGAFPAGDSPDGFHDLGGNVREWTASRVGKDRVVRGGSWGDSLAAFLSAGFRGMNAAEERFEITGFRCAAPPGEAGRPAAPGPVASPAARIGPLARGEAPPEAVEEEGVIVAPPDPDPAEAPRPAPSPPGLAVRAAPAAPPARPPAAPPVVRVAVPRVIPLPPPPVPVARPAPREAVEIGEIKIESLSGGR